MEDRFTGEMAKAAAATALLNRELNSLSGNAVKSDRSMVASEKRVSSLGNSSEKSGKQIDKLSGRLALLAQAAAVLGPALVPIGAAGIPAIAGLTAEMGFTVAAVGTAVLAFHGLGDGLKSLNKYQLDPSAENLAKLNQELDKLGPAGAEFVRFLDDIGPQLKNLQFAARDGLFPGLEDGIQSLMTMLPQVSRIVSTISKTMGDLAGEAGAGLAGGKFTAFFDYIEHDAQPTLVAMGHTLGNLFDGFAAMLVAFTPLSRGFTAGFESMSASFADWAHSLQGSSDFAAFVDYVQQSGPQVLDLLGSLAQAFVGIAEAAAPVGAVVVPMLTAMADVIAAISKSDIGTPIFAGLAAMSLLSRATASYGRIAETSFGGATIGSIKGMGAALVTVTSAQERATLSASALAKAEGERAAAMRGGLATLGKSAVAMGGLALATSGAADGLAMSNTASLALMGTMVGPWGAAIGGSVGLAMDLAHANDDLEASFKSLKLAMDSATPTADSMAAFEAAVDHARAKLDDFKAKMAADGNSNGDSWNPFGQDTKDSLSRAKNTIEGWFGSSDVEEHEAALAKAAAAAQKLREESSLVGASSSQLAQGMDQAAQAAIHEAASIDQTIDAMRNLRAETAKNLNAHLGYKASILDARDALKDNGKTVNENTRAGQANLTALYSLATAWNAQSDGAKNATGSLKRAKANFIDTAAAMGMPIKQAEKLARRLFEIPEKVLTRIEADTSDAERQIKALKRELNSIDRNVDIYINAHASHLPNMGGFGPQITPADGATVPGPRYPYGDKIPALLAPGEEVISNRHGQADRNRALLKEINANRLADGGTAGYARRYFNDRHQSPMHGRAGSASRVAVSLNGLQVTGTLQTPWGPAQIEGIARGAAREEIDADRRFDNMSKGR